MDLGHRLIEKYGNLAKMFETITQFQRFSFTGSLFSLIPLTHSAFFEPLGSFIMSRAGGKSFKGLESSQDTERRAPQ